MSDELQTDDTVNLLSGDTYILYNDMRGHIVFWIDCNKELQIRMSTDEFRKSAYSIFPNIKLSELLTQLNQGNYVFTDKLILRPLKPKKDFQRQLVPTIKDLKQAGYFNNIQNRNGIFQL
jgi:hypothetical protein